MKCRLICQIPADEKAQIKTKASSTAMEEARCIQ